MKDAAEAAKAIDAANKEAEANVPNDTVKASEDKLDQAARNNDNTQGDPAKDPSGGKDPAKDPAKEAAQKKEDDARAKADEVNGDKSGDKYREALKDRREACKKLKKALAELRKRLGTPFGRTEENLKAIRDAEKAQKEQEKTPERPKLSMVIPQRAPTLATLVASGKSNSTAPAQVKPLATLPT